jgi:phosphohistidine phosphatase
MSNTRRLILLRHAKAERSESGSFRTDEVRALAPVGHRNSATVGGKLLDADLVPDLVLCSAAVRTRQTWDLVKAALKSRSSAEVEYLDILYTAGVTELVDVLREVDDRARTVLVVGHEPTMSAAAVRLASPDSSTDAVAQVRSGLPTATCAVLNVESSWSELEPRSADLVDVISGRN